MKITKLRNNSETEIFNGSAMIQNTNKGFVFSENRSSSADKRINVHKVYLSKEDIVKALKHRLSKRVPKFMVNCFGWVILKVMR